jgi:ankyrin repeat protein
MIQKKTFYDNYRFGNPFVDPKQHPLYVPSAFYIYDIITTVKQRLLGHASIQLAPKPAQIRDKIRRNAAFGFKKQYVTGGGGIWFALRNNQLVLTQLIAQRYRRQLKERSSEASKYLPLHYATRSKDFPFEVVKAIVLGYEDGLFEVDAYGMTPLHLAIRERRGQRVVKLLTKPEICRMKTNTGETPLHLAIIHRADNKIIRILLQADGNFHTPLKTPSSTAIYLTHQQATMSIPAKKMLNDHGLSPFHLSVKKFDGSENSKKRIQLFLDSDESGEISGNNEAKDMTPGIVAHLNASPYIVSCSRTWTFSGELPLHLALENGLCQKYTSFSTAGGFWLVKLLLAKFSDAILLPKRKNKLLPLHLAIKRALPSEIVMYLLEETANASSGFSLDTSSSTLLRTSNHMTLLHYAMIYRVPDDTIISLCKKSPKEILSEKNDKGDLPLHLAAYLYENTEIIKLMIEREPSGIMIRNNKGQFPLHLAVEGNKHNNVHFLLQMCPWSLFKQDGHERDVLILACKRKWPDDEMLEFLMEAPSFQGKRWEYQSQKQITPFYAISTGKCKKEIIEKHIPTQLLKLAHTTEEEMVHLAKKTLRRKHYCPTTKWEFPKILQVIECNPSNEAVMQRALLAINQKLEQIALAKSKDEDIPRFEREEWVLNHITLNKELGLVRALHNVLYEFPHNTRIQILGTACMRRLLPNPYSKAKYQAIVDPYFNLQVAPPKSKSRSNR